jgi:nucleoside-diphosphate-sugar epimerase
MRSQAWRGVWSILYPYRAKAQPNSDLAWFYEKILVERLALEAAKLPATILRLPKVYGPGDNADRSSIPRPQPMAVDPNGGGPMGYVENVAHAIVLAATHPQAAGRIYNVGEAYTPTVAERLKLLPDSPQPGYREPVSYAEGIRRSIAAMART